MSAVIPSSLLRAYDIRGVYGQDLTEQAAFELGQRFGMRTLESNNHSDANVVIARDGRTHSPQLSSAFIKGLCSVGCHVIDIGLAPTPAVSFALMETSSGFHAGVMNTGSHNPPEHNGFKLTLGFQPFFGEDIQNLMRVDIRISATPGTYRQDTSAVDRYVQHLLEKCPSLPKGVKVVWDCGHGATGPVVQAVAQAWRSQGSSVEILYGEVDGRFPAHAPDPSNAKNMADLISHVNTPNTIGLGLDGDGDRLGVVCPSVGLLPGEQTLWHMARSRLKQNQDGIVLMDIKMSAQLPPLIKTCGGESFVWKTGHAHIKKKMKEINDVVIAGEASGHFFFPELGYDDGLYAAMCVMSEYNSLDESIQSYPPSCITPELRLHCDENPQAVISKVRQMLDEQGINYNDLDGVRVESSEGWWLARASHTESVITVRIESFTGSLQKLSCAVYELLKDVLPTHSFLKWEELIQPKVETTKDIQLEQP